MKRTTGVMAAVMAAAIVVGGCSDAPMSKSDPRWITLIDGDTGLDNWNRVGDANWHAANGAIVADRGKESYLVSKNVYKDFELRAEFWVETATNSGIFIRCSDPAKITGPNCYEVNIWDTRPDPTYGTGAIVNVYPVPVPIVYKAGGHWNTYEIYAKGAQLTIKFNGIVTASIQNNNHSSGYVALQFGAGANGAPPVGPLKWRRVEIRPL